VQPDRGRPPLAAASLGRSALPAPAWNGTQATSAPDGACAWAARDRRMTREFGEKTNRGRVELWSCGAVELVLRKQCNEGSLPLFCSHGPSGALRATTRVWSWRPINPILDYGSGGSCLLTAHADELGHTCLHGLNLHSSCWHSLHQLAAITEVVPRARPTAGRPYRKVNITPNTCDDLCPRRVTTHVTAE
jgi:hypothetical protein